MRYLKWLAIAAIGYIAYLVYRKINNPIVPAKPQEGRGIPGYIGDSLNLVKGVFNLGPNPVTHPVNSAYGQGAGGSGYVPQGISLTAIDTGHTSSSADTLVPAFLEGATGGAIDEPMPSIAPPRILGVAGPPGTGQIASPPPMVASKIATIVNKLNVPVPSVILPGRTPPVVSPRTVNVQ